MSSGRDKARTELTENGVYHLVCGLQRGLKILCEGNIKIPELCREALWGALVVFIMRKLTSNLIKFMFGLDRVKDCWLIAIMKQVAGCHQPITAFRM